MQDTSLIDNAVFAKLADTSGPHSYTDIESLICTSLLLVPVIPEYAQMHAGKYLACQLRDSGLGHCMAVTVTEQSAFQIEPDLTGLPTCNYFDDTSFDAYAWLCIVADGSPVPETYDTDMKDTVAGSESDSEVSVDECSSRLGVGATLNGLMREEVKSTWDRLTTHGDVSMQRDDGDWQCPLCPSYITSRKQYLKTHCDLYHVHHSACAKDRRHGKQVAVASRMLEHAVFNGAAADLFGSALRLKGEDMPVQADLLSRSAGVLMQSVVKSPTWKLGSGTPAGHDIVSQPSRFERNLKVLLDVPACRYVLNSSADDFHVLTPSTVCTDAFLTAVFVGAIHPATHGQSEPLFFRLVEKCDTSAVGLPKPPILRSLAKALMAHPVTEHAVTQARANMEKRVLTIDSTFKILNKVEGQRKHGAAKHDDDDDVDACGVVTTVCSKDGLIYAAPSPTEKWSFQRDMLKAALNGVTTADTLMLASDTPGKLDRGEFYDLFGSLQCICGDPAHVYFRLEKASGNNKTDMTSVVRLFVHKFRFPPKVQSKFYERGETPAKCITIASALRGMTKLKAQFRMARVHTARYINVGYASASEYVLDFAAVVKTFPDEMNRQGDKKQKVYDTIDNACNPVEIEYLFNLGRFAAKYPAVPLPYGTTGNEACHSHLNYSIYGVRSCSLDYVRTHCTFFTVRTLLTGHMCRATMKSNVRRTTSLKSPQSRGHALAGLLERNSLKFRPLVDLTAVRGQPALKRARR